MLLLSTLYSSKKLFSAKIWSCMAVCCTRILSLSHTHTHTHTYICSVSIALSSVFSTRGWCVCVCVSVLIIQDCFYCLSSIHSLSSVWLLADRRFNSAINNLSLTFDPCGCTNCLMLCRWSQALKNCRDVSGPDLP